MAKFKKFESEICDANTRTAKSKVPIGKYPLAVHPFEELNFDILGPLPVTKSGKKYIIAYIDRFSRFSILDSLKDRMAVTVADSLFKRVISTFSGVKMLISDNAAEFNG